MTCARREKRRRLRHFVIGGVGGVLTPPATHRAVDLQPARKKAARVSAAVSQWQGVRVEALARWCDLLHQQGCDDNSCDLLLCEQGRGKQTRYGGLDLESLKILLVKVLTMEGLKRVQSNHDRAAYWSGTPNSFCGGGPGQLMRPALEVVQEHVKEGG